MAKKKAATFGEYLIEGMNLVLTHQQGKVELEQVWPKSTLQERARKIRSGTRSA